MGETYLVYAVRDEADPMRVSLCSRTAPVDKAKKDLDFLKKPTHTFDGKKSCAAAPGTTSPAELAMLGAFLWVLTLTSRRLV